MTRETLKKDIIITLGGYVAEKMIFGEEMTSSGVYNDVEEASRLANKAIRNYAMGSDPIYLAVESTQNEDAFFVSSKHAGEAVAIIKTCVAEAEELLQRNKLLLLKMAEYLTTNLRMEADTIEAYVKEYAAEAWVQAEGFIRKDDYYKFNTTVHSRIRELQNEDPAFSIERLVPETTAERVM